MSSGIPKPSGKDAPEPWNFNDTIVWKGIIQKNTSSATYNTTSRLESLCPEIIKYQLPVLDPVIEAEKEILNRNTFPAIRNLLSELAKSRDLDIYEGSKIVDESTLYLINQLGVIYISLNDKISISPIGQMVVTLLDQYFERR